MPPLCGLFLFPVLMQDTVAAGLPFDDRFPLELACGVRDDAGGSALMEALDWMCLHPYDLNSITMDELLTIPCMTLSRAQSVIAFREGGGHFRSKGDLLTFPGGGEELYRVLSPYVRLGRKHERGVSMRVRATRAIPPEQGTLGSPLQVFSRISLEGYSGLEAGAVLAKGAGERAKDALVSAYAVIRGLGPVTEIAAGDYELESGEGLVFWQGPTALGGEWTLRGGDGLAIVPHRSSDPFRFLRGLAIAAASGGRWRGALFLSDRSYGATVDTQGEATSFFRGEYTTAASTSRKDQLRERLAGVRCEYRSHGFLSAGCTIYRSFFDRSFAPADRMRLSGSRLDAAGVDLTWSLGGVRFSGEYALIIGGSHACLWSIRTASDAGQTLVVRARDYQPGYDNPHAWGEGQDPETRNERGVTATLGLLPCRGITARVLVDAFDHPWPDAHKTGALSGVELTVTGEGSLPGGGTASLRFSRKVSCEQRAGTDQWGRDVLSAAAASDDRFGCEVSCPAGSRLAFSTFLGIRHVSRSGGDCVGGQLLGGEIRLALPERFMLEARFSLFHTDGYAARLYELESGLPGVISLPPLYGHGARWYLRMRGRAAAWADLTIRYAQTLKETSVEGPPLREIPATSAAQVALQADIRMP